MTSINESSHTTEPTISAETAAHIARFRQMEEEALPWVEMIENGTITEEDFRSMMAHAHQVSYLYNKILLTIIDPELKLENLSEPEPHRTDYDVFYATVTNFRPSFDVKAFAKRHREWFRRLKTEPTH